MSGPDGPGEKTLWGGRFGEGPDPRIEAFTHSLPFDRRLVRHDLRASIAHVRMLGRQGIVAPEEAGAIEAGLRDLLRDVEAGAAIEGAEDVHTWVELRLRERIGRASCRERV